jgi:GT2 family glycosyltransferase
VRVLDSALLDLPAGSDGVSHVELGQPPVAGARMTVFWRGGRPVGHELTAPDGEIQSKMSRQPEVLSKSGKSTPLSVSVIICTRDGPEDLARCLNSLPRQSYPVREVIVVDNGSKDGRTRDTALAAGAVYLRENRAGLSFARNAGVQRAVSEIVAFTDDDVVLHADWLARLIAAFDVPEVGAVTGLVLPGELATEAQLHFESYWSFGQGYDRQDFTPGAFRDNIGTVMPAWKIGAGASMAIRREVFERAGGFDVRLGAGQSGCSEDSEFWYRLIANGYICRYEPASVAFHFHRRTMEALGSQIYYYMRGHCVALFVQYQRTGVRANLSRAIYWMPRYYAVRLLKAMRRRNRFEYQFLGKEIAGYFGGVIFFLRHVKEGPGG